MAGHYDTVEQETRLFIEAFGPKGYGWTPFRRGQADCGLDEGSDCIVGLGGCPRESKQTRGYALAVHHLAAAARHQGKVGKNGKL
jgi:hypothetical protein